MLSFVNLMKQTTETVVEGTDCKAEFPFQIAKQRHSDNRTLTLVAHEQTTGSIRLETRSVAMPPRNRREIHLYAVQINF